MSDFQAKIKAILDLSGISGDIKKIESNKVQLSIDKNQILSDIGEIKKAISDLNNIKIQIGTNTSSGKSSSSASGQIKNQVKEIQESYKEIYNLANKIGKLEIKIGGLNSGSNANQISVLTSQLNELKATYDKLMSSFAGNLNKSNLTVGQLGNLNQIFTDTENKLSELEAKLSDTKSKLANSISIKLDNSQFSKEITTLETGMSKLSTVSTELQSSFNNLKTSMSDMKSAQSSGDVDKLISSYKNYESELKNVNNLLTEATKKQQQQAEAQKLAFSRTDLNNQMEIWLKNNSAAADQFGARVRQLQSELQGCDKVKLNSIKSEFKQIRQEAELAGKTSTTFLNSLKSTVGIVTGITSVYAAITKVKTSIQSGIQTVVDLDTALVDLQKTTTATASELNKFYEDANSVAKEYGATTQQIIQSAADWSRLGYNIDESKLMSQYSSMFKSISPGMTINSSTSGLVSIMKAFGIEASDVLDEIMSKINIVGNSFATSNADIVEGLQRSSAAMAAGNNTLEDTVALFTSAEEIINDPASVGNALKTISMRLRGYDEESETLSEDLKSITGDIADLTKTASNNYTGVSLFTDETRETYKSTAQILKDISDIWDELTDKTQAEDLCLYVQKCA